MFEEQMYKWLNEEDFKTQPSSLSAVESGLIRKAAAAAAAVPLGENKVSAAAVRKSAAAAAAAAASTQIPTTDVAGANWWGRGPMRLLQEVSRIFRMGICLDTDRSGSPLVGDTKSGDLHAAALLANSTSQMETTEALTGAPVIFVMGGPGSGKMTHAQNLADIHEGYRHINMYVVISEYVKENGLGPPDSISSTVALALLAREMHQASRSKGFLVSGYPRSLEDINTYTEKLGKIDGAILLDWQESTLLHTMEVGSRLGEVVLEAARKELADFHTRVLPVCEYLDNLGVLFVVAGDRGQEDVFRDVQRALNRIIHPPPHPTPSRASIGSYREYRSMAPFLPNTNLNTMAALQPGGALLPPCLFLMGGPGSDKDTMVKHIMYLYPGWVRVGLGDMFRDHLERWRQDPEGYTDLPEDKVQMLESLMTKGDFIPQDLVLQVLSDRLEKEDVRRAEGIVIVGFPRDVIQAQNFEEKFCQIPPLLLIDCSELELGRNLGRRELRIDDNVTAARHRLAVYREVTLPMLKAFDEKNRLKIIDGDADADQVLRELKRAIYVETQYLARLAVRGYQQSEDENSIQQTIHHLPESVDLPVHLNGHVTAADVEIKSLSHEFSDPEMKDLSDTGGGGARS
ncbi:adenylate kinase isoenzyme 5 isoform X2 [Oratosquilla oratoria]|uniref:adenylate kinase isoenzyme 5 isoform X2 n=1 Tax=Oratosquilla oratoria TaxID=337810 RepID=UPI003F75B40D